MNFDKKTKLIVVAGPTASGKTSLAIDIAKAVNGEIISADSMQVYKGMSVATAAPTLKEKSQINHRLVEFLDRSKAFSVSDFCRLAEKEIKEICALGKTPIIAGGTGLFIDSLVDNIKFSHAQTDFKLREELMAESEQELYDRLLSVDKNAAEKIHKNNKKRVVRALEIYYLSGKTKSEQDIQSKKYENPYDTLYFVIMYKNRDVLYNRINQRVDFMVENGLFDEARRCLESEGITSAQAIGHKELKPYFDGLITAEEAVENLKKETRRYAKRQITWFKKRKNSVQLFADEMSSKELISTAVNKSREFLNG